MATQVEKAPADFIDSLVTMIEATVVAYAAIYGLPPDGIPVQDLNEIATQLSWLVPLFLLSPDRTSITPLSKADLQGGTFSDAGRLLTYQDGRASLTGLAMTRDALKAAIARLKMKAH